MVCGERVVNPASAPFRTVPSETSQVLFFSPLGRRLWHANVTSREPFLSTNVLYALLL